MFAGERHGKIVAGHIVKIHITTLLNDKVFYSSLGKVPVYTMSMDVPKPYDISEVWTEVQVGDSLVTVQLSDSILMNTPDAENVLEKGSKVINRIKILNAFPDDSTAQKDKAEEESKQLQKEISFIENYLNTEKIKAIKTPSGAFVQIIRPGTGKPAKGNTVSIYYTGYMFSGTKLDSNTDSSFHHLEPLQFVAGGGMMIKGFDEAVSLLQKGAIARFYLPSMLSYGSMGLPQLPPYENLIYDVEIIEIKENK